MPSRRSLLIVDDCRDWTDSLAILGRAWGYEVEIANSGQEAIRLASGKRPALTLLDLGMPGMDGYEVARRLRSLPGAGDALIVAVSGYDGETYERRSREAGCDFHLTKPVDLAHLQRLLSAAAAGETRPGDGTLRSPSPLYPGERGGTSDAVTGDAHQARRG